MMFILSHFPHHSINHNPHF